MLGLAESSRRRGECCFLQAEAGIPAPLVVGVQTCALPIYTAAAGSIIVSARRVDISGSPALAAFESSTERYRSLWLRPDEHTRIAALGAVETIEPDGADRFSEASAARAALSARVQRRGPADAPAPVLIGGFSFSVEIGRAHV